MLCPEVWSFLPPGAEHHNNRGNFKKDSSLCDKLINLHHFNHLVSVVLPKISSVPDRLLSILNVDSDYYKVQKVNIAEFVNKGFIESFVKKGSLTVLSDSSRVDVEDCMCITPNGQLVLDLLRETYVELGLEGKPSSFTSSTPARYIVTLDLCSPSFVPGKKNYERVRESLRQRLHAFDVLLVWEPSGKNVCPSSVASHLHNCGYTVLLCHPRAKQYCEKSVKVPIFPECDGSDDGDVEDFLEWLGAFLLQADLSSGHPDNFVTCYEPPSSCVMCGEVLVLEWRGYFSAQRIYSLYTRLRKFVGAHKVIPWASLHVQGFADCPLSWGKKEHTFFTEGDNHYTLLLQPPQFLACTVSSSNRRPRNTTKS